MRTLLVMALISLFTLSAHAQESDAHRRSLYGHFMAPCCWTESLALHDSPLAVSLREEIDARLARGDTASAIEADLVSRYGQRVLSTPPGYGGIAGVLVLLIALSGVLLFRSRARAAMPSPQADAVTAPLASDALDARIDEELRLLEDDA